ncbi:hypothetical protein [Crateriforma spongiae]|uniref:hypothetical protein n=1 Tax=Crateriforma spongiae TaxID=2724528 RepID=UPI0014465B10|nr:hypothetical protein [Crateriforma spongiae]
MKRPRFRPFDVQQILKRLTPMVCLAVFAAVTLTSTQCGCLGIAANLMHAVGADKIPPEYENYKDLKDKRIAVVTLTEASRYSNDTASRFLSRQVGQILTSELKDLRLVREDEVQQWRDENGFDNMEFAQLGKDLKADRVLVVDVTDLSLRDGQSLYRGQCSATVELIDPADGSLLFSRDIDEFTYPENAGQHVSETTETKFEKLYLSVLAARVGRLFHPYDFGETVALDGMIASQ